MADHSSPPRRGAESETPESKTPDWGRFGTPLLLAVFYGVLTPLGLLGRLAGLDPLRLKRNRRLDSYWIERGPR